MSFEFLGEIKWELGHLPTRTFCDMIPASFKKYYSQQFPTQGCKIMPHYYKHTEEYRLSLLEQPEVPSEWRLNYLPTQFGCSDIPGEFRIYYEPTYLGSTMCKIKSAYYKYTAEYQESTIPPEEPPEEPEEPEEPSEPPEKPEEEETERPSLSPIKGGGGVMIMPPKETEGIYQSGFMKFAPIIGILGLLGVASYWFFGRGK